MLILYHDWDSLQSMKVRMCLAEKALAYEGRIVELTRFEHLRPAHLTVNPAGLVPVLRDGSATINESSVINEYLEDVAPSGLRPQAPAQRAAMRLWARYQDEEVHPAIRPATFQLMIRPRLAALSERELESLIATHPLPQRAAAFRDWARGEVDHGALLDAVARLDRIVQRMEDTLADSPWLAGASFSLADIALASFVDRIEHLGLALLWHGRPGVQRWAAALKSRPAYAAAVCPEWARLPAPAPVVLDEMHRRWSARGGRG